MSSLNLLLHFIHNGNVQSRVYSPVLRENSYLRQQLLSDFALLYKGVDSRLLHLNYDLYLVVHVKTQKGWVEIPSKTRNLIPFFRVLHVETHTLIELKLEFVTNVEEKYIANEFFNQLANAAQLCEGINDDKSTISKETSSSLEVCLVDHYHSFEKIVRSEHYLELMLGLKYYLAVKEGCLFVVIKNWTKCPNPAATDEKHCVEQLANAFNINHLHSLIEKKTFQQIIFCGHASGAMVARHVVNQVLKKQQEVDRRHHRALQWTNRDLLCISFGSPFLPPNSSSPSAQAFCCDAHQDKIFGSFFLHFLLADDHLLATASSARPAAPSTRSLFAWRSSSSSSSGATTGTTGRGKGRGSNGAEWVSDVTLLFPGERTGQTAPRLVSLSSSPPPLPTPSTHSTPSTPPTPSGGTSMATYHQTCLHFLHSLALSTPSPPPTPTSPPAPAATAKSPDSPSRSPVLAALDDGDGVDAADEAIRTSSFSTSFMVGHPLASTPCSLLQVVASLLPTAMTTITTTTSDTSLTTPLRTPSSPPPCLVQLVEDLMVLDPTCAAEEAAVMRYLRTCAIRGSFTAAAAPSSFTLTSSVVDFVQTIETHVNGKARMVAVVVATVAHGGTTYPYVLYLSVKHLLKHHLALAALAPFIPALLHLFPADSPWLPKLVKLFRPALPETIPRYPLPFLVYPLAKQGFVQYRLRPSASTSAASLWRAGWRTGWLRLEKGFLFFFAFDHSTSSSTSSATSSTGAQRLVTAYYLKGFVVNENPAAQRLALTSATKEAVLRFPPGQTPGQTPEDLPAWRTAFEAHLDLFPPSTYSVITTTEEVLM